MSKEITLKVDPSIDFGDYEPTEYRKVSLGEDYMASSGLVVRWPYSNDSGLNYLILKKKPWVPKLWEDYYSITSVGVEHRIMTGDLDCNETIELGNCFKTEELAQAAFDLSMTAPKE